MRLALLLILFGACAHPRPPVLAPELQKMAFYVGTWHCEGTTFGAHEEHWQATVKVTPELDGHWLAVEMIGPGANRTAEHKGYDTEHKRYVHVAVVNDGSWGVLTSPGWDGEHMVFAPLDPADPTRATFTKLGDDRFSHGESHGDTRDWEKTCTKG